MSFLAQPILLSAAELTGKVVKIADGDTLTILDINNRQHRVRLAGIDAPEAQQPFGQKSKQQLTEEVAGKDVLVDWDKKDRYERIVGKVIYNNQDINLKQLKEGMAWWYRKYANEQSKADQRLYEDAEVKAKNNGIGLWSENNPIAPWEWRRIKP